MDTYVIFADIGRSIVIIACCYLAVAAGLTISAWRYNKTKLKAYKERCASEEIKAVFSSKEGLYVTLLGLLISFGVADSKVSVFILGIPYLALFYYLAIARQDH